jgi:hypothetical protein
MLMTRIRNPIDGRKSYWIYSRFISGVSSITGILSSQSLRLRSTFRTSLVHISPCSGWVVPDHYGKFQWRIRTYFGACSIGVRLYLVGILRYSPGVLVYSLDCQVLHGKKNKEHSFCGQCEYRTKGGRSARVAVSAQTVGHSILSFET